MSKNLKVYGGRKLREAEPGKIPQKHKQTSTASRGWSRKLGLLYTKRDRFSSSLRRQFRRRIELDHYTRHNNNGFLNASNFLNTISPIVQDYFSGNSAPSISLVRLESVAAAASEEAIKRYKIRNTSKKNRQIVENFVRLGLYYAEVTGPGKYFPVEQINPSKFLKNGRLNLRNVLEEEARLFNLEGQLELNGALSRRIVQEEAINIFEHRSYDFPNGVYPLTEELRLRLRSTTLTPQSVYEAINHIVSDTNYLLIRPVASLELIASIKQVLIEADEQTLMEYGGEIGLYLLGRHIKKITGQDIPLRTLDNILQTKEHVTSLIGESENSENASGLIWNPKQFDFTVDEMDRISEFIKSKYYGSADSFFRKYRESHYLFAMDIASAGLIEDPNRIVQITQSGLTLQQLIEIDDDRFSKEWNIKPVNMDFSTVMRIFEHLRMRYGQQLEHFFTLYGSPAGPVILAKEVQVKYNLLVTPKDISNLLTNGYAISQILQSRDEKRFETNWNIKPLSLTLREAEEILDKIISSYSSDPNLFFSSYQNSPALLAEETHRNCGYLNKESLEFLVHDGRVLQFLLGTNDPRFSEWGYKQSRKID